jgi:DNA anti-recombination protein RmuC
MNSSQLSNEDSDIKLFKVFNKLKNAQHSKVSHKELKKVKQEKESLIVQLSESHALIDSLKSENTMLLNIIDILENKLEKFSNDNLKSMLCIHSDISNKLALSVDDMSASTSHTSHASDSELDIKLVIVDTTCLEYSCLNHMMPNPKESGTRGKFVLFVIIVGKLVILGQIVIC